MVKVVRYLNTESHWFPTPQEALNDPNGLLAIGGDLSPKRLIQAYHSGIFPWFNPDEPILWWSPDPRAVFRVNDHHAGKSLRKSLRRAGWQITLNRDFAAVIDGCAAPRAKQDGTWISAAMRQSYLTLHRMGVAHSIEVWDGDQLVGGLYGLRVGGLFCGESMFHRQTDASKVAFWALNHHLHQCGIDWIDAQVPNAHLANLGARTLSRDRFLNLLARHRDQPVCASQWQTREIELDV
ncbi:leucyl/phenylalanyl-tRNA--protein transferase [Ferrimonas sediminum]|uniref:Leucyl/phenylalanyl-tRNA--protein transferase n=1 Tax=Ferrimonas sediminum TaxID=718193 RepID=A0A1G8NCT7_9GAMM|nr:leucyl/phenylalanyl-tRNA--protein transferase [Ferrimonas sediminum]SDI77877.1 leucyl/phenylalanyl-tRNA--protein transferase [Ferrimonas sediminum]